ncbi:MAG: hypothetical protein U9Q67_00795 [Patescibacteria group bacterium]|nr:hypothetical protein [Patescibacteria group bacterium]
MLGLENWNELETRVGITDEAVQRSICQASCYLGELVLPGSLYDGYYNDFQFKSGGRFFPKDHGVQQVLGLTGLPLIDNDCEHTLAYILLSIALEQYSVLDTEVFDEWRSALTARNVIAGYMESMSRGIVDNNEDTELALTSEELANVTRAIANFRDHGSFDPAPTEEEATGL